MTTQNKKYMLNRSSMDTKENKAALIFHILNPDTAEITKTYEILFHVEQTQYFLRRTKGALECFRITRFRPTMFQVDRVMSSIAKTNIIYNYEIKNKENPEDLFDTLDFEAIFFEAEKIKVVFDGQVMNLADTTEIILQSTLTTEKTFLKLFSVFVMAGSGGLLLENLRAENIEFFNKINV